MIRDGSTILEGSKAWVRMPAPSSTKILFLELLLYIVGGFLFYASMYAAIGSAVDTPQDAAQFNGIIMMPVIVAIMVMMSVMNDPNSDLVFWCSIIPFTSPIVMMARIPFGIPTWEIVVSLILLYISFILMTWVAARIFRVGNKKERAFGPRTLFLFQFSILNFQFSIFNSQFS